MIKSTLYVAIQGFISCVCFALMSSAVTWMAGEEIISMTFGLIYAKQLTYIYFLKLNFILLWTIYWMEKIWNLPIFEALTIVIEKLFSTKAKGGNDEHTV